MKPKSLPPQECLGANIDLLRFREVHQENYGLVQRWCNTMEPQMYILGVPPVVSSMFKCSSVVS
ncbi:hypothetical protein DPMN_130998 [Dreissena polymorpha]|uniref:Uncharacterized protein n=1 Tax=Dreissena polymorpha TaxID=45954 RepID=A0A9D4JY30_DREPO|nr:hypothetical protein DPMN_130998 [Dreissena polymorpha]